MVAVRHSHTQRKKETATELFLILDFDVPFISAAGVEKALIYSVVVFM